MLLGNIKHINKNKKTTIAGGPKLVMMNTSDYHALPLKFLVR